MNLLHLDTILIQILYEHSTKVTRRPGFVKSLSRVCIVCAVSVGGRHRIGEFARRVGVTPELLRAWEQRYGLLQPVRTPGGFRVYGEEDAERVARMRRGLDEGLSAAEAAGQALADAPSADRLIEE